MTLRFADLHEIAPASGAPFGGKAIGLARLIAAGAGVPSGFAVEATTTLPAHWGDAEREEFLRRAARLLARGPIAVRSSALCEDGRERSFAGLFETVLGIPDEASALAAAARCISSGAGERATRYAGTAAALPVGLVCQTQIDARSAGVCFTVDPTGQDGAVLVEAVRGLGDALVSGSARPDRWRVYRTAFGTWEGRREASAETAMSATEATEVARGAADLATRFGVPLDLEWARDAQGRLWWLQARPITRPAPPRQWHVDRSFAGDDGPVTVWANWNIRETMPDPLSPLSWTVWRDVLLRLMVRSVMDLPERSPLFHHLSVLDRVQGRVYWNMNALLSLPGLGALATSTLRFVDEEAGRVFPPLRAKGVVRPRRLPGSRIELFLSLLSTQAKAVTQMFETLAPGRIARRLEAFGEEEARRARRDVRTLSDMELIAEIRHLDGPAGRVFIGVMNVMGMAMTVYQAACLAFRRSPEAVRRMVTGLKGNPTTRISLGIDALVEQARPLAQEFLAPRSPEGLLARLADVPPGREWMGALHAFLAEFGQRCPKEFDIASTRWAEDPAMIVELVRAGLRAGPGESVRARLERLAAMRREAIDAAIQAAPAWKRPLMRFLARRVEMHAPLREAPKHYLMIAFLRMRLAALELGRRLAERGVLRSIEEVFLLEFAELERLARGETILDLADLLDRRSAELSQFEREAAPDFVRSDGVPVEGLDGVKEEGPALRGTPVSGGSAAGPVRIMREPDATAMREGDVLVVAFADPGWTPLFPRAAALVMEVGGAMCHAAVVARELGVPSVFGVKGATRRLRDGERVTVDGDRGVVSRES